jgi:hypothetical protein
MGTPYGIGVFQWLSPLGGVPCSQPPYGAVMAVDLKSRKVVWQSPAGTVAHSGPLGIRTHLPMPVGLPAYAGPMATAGGLVFFAGYQDNTFSAPGQTSGIGSYRANQRHWPREDLARGLRGLAVATAHSAYRRQPCRQNRHQGSCCVPRRQRRPLLSRVQAHLRCAGSHLDQPPAHRVRPGPHAHDGRTTK